MKPWLWMMLCLGCLALAGCRANSYRTMLEQESRQWEDRYYVVKDRLDECQAVLESTRQRNLELEPSAGGPGSLIFPGLKGKSGGALAPPNIEGMSSDGFQKVTPDSLQLQTPEKIEPGESQPPATSPTEPVDPDSVAPPFKPGAEAPLFKQPDTKRASNLSGDSSEVARIELIGMTTDGYDSDGRPGDDGVRFVLQPRDQNGKVVDASGPISIVVVDPLPEGKSVRLARWDLTPEQAAGYYDRSPRGFHLRLPWPSSTPKHSRLRLFARYATADGRKVQAEKAITVALAGEQTPNWSIDPPPELPQSPATTRSTLTLQSPPAVTPQARQQPDRPRVAAQPRPAQPQRKRPVWSPDRK